MKSSYYFYYTISFLLLSCSSVSAQNWESVYSTAENLTIGDVDTPNDSAIWAVGQRLSFSNNQIFYGNSGRFYRSADFGRTWNVGTIATGQPFISNISAINAQTAWASVVDRTNRSGIFKTTNGGMNWDRSETPYVAASFVNFVHFWNEKEGLTMGDPRNGRFEIYSTGNGGTTWQTVATANIPPPVDDEIGYNNIFSVVGNHIWFMTNKSRVFRSTNKGLNWQAFDTELGDNTSGQIAFNSKMQGLAIKAEFDARTASFNSQISHSLDSGTTWKRLNNTISPDLFLDLKALPSGAFVGTVVREGGFLTGTYCTIISYDVGQTWKTIHEGNKKVGAMGSLTPKNILWAGGISVGGRGLEIFKMTDAPLTGFLTPSVLDAKISLSPNPVADQLNIQLTYKKSSNFRLNINNLSGALVYFEDFKDVSNINKSLNIKQLPSGTYILTVANPTGNVSRKFVKME